MRIYIAADMEGVAGVMHPGQTVPGSPEYERAALLMTGEVNAAVTGALEGGAREVWVADGHGGYRNVLLEHLHPQARLIAGKPRPGGMLAGLEATGPWDGIFLLGYHARAGSSGVLAHTINSKAFALVSVDGQAVGEALLSAAVAGEQGIAVLLVSGDDCLVREVEMFLPDVSTVTVKQSLAWRAAMHLPIPLVRENLRRAAAQAVGLSGKPYVLTSPVRVEVTTVQPVQADAFALVPGVERLHPSTVGFEAANATRLMGMLNVFSLMAGGLQ